MYLGMDADQTNSVRHYAEFRKWYFPELETPFEIDVGSVIYNIEDTLIIEAKQKVDLANIGNIQFEVPLAIRITSEGNLASYWRTGLLDSGHSLYVAEKSSFLDWLSISSSGVQTGSDIRHFAIFSDDVCIEVLTRIQPSIILENEPSCHQVL